MPDEKVPTDDPELNAQLDRVCITYGIETRAEAAEFLLKRRLRRGASQISGRGRALYPVTRGKR